MKEDFVTYEIAKKLKEKGFDKFCENGYFLKSGIEYSVPNDDRVLVSSIGERIFNTECCWFEEEIEYGRDIIYAPTIYQVLKWLREEKNIFIAINIGYCYESDEIPFPTNPKMEPILKGYYYGIWELDNLNDKNARSEYFESHEIAALAGIEYVLDNLI